MFIIDLPSQQGLGSVSLVSRGNAPVSFVPGENAPVEELIWFLQKMLLFRARLERFNCILVWTRSEEQTESMLNLFDGGYGTKPTWPQCVPFRKGSSSAQPFSISARLVLS